MTRSRARVVVAVAVFCALNVGPAQIRAETLEADLLIVGGTESGCAAAVQAARMGVESIVLVNDIDWLGGQFSAEALVAIDENRGPAGYDHTVPFPRAGLFREIIDRIESLNERKYGRARPGNTRVITTCRPADAEQVFREWLQPHVDSGRVRIVAWFEPVAAEVDDETSRLRAVTFRSTNGAGQTLTVRAAITIDASDWGDAIQAAGAEYEFGPDLKAKYGEPLAPVSREGYPVTDINPITYCMVLNETDRYEPIAEPPGYDARSYRDHLWPKDPLWLYASRRVIDRYNFADVTHPDVLLLCFPAFDYPLDVYPHAVADALEEIEAGASQKNIVQMTPAQRRIVFEDAKQYSLGFLYYLQTEVHESMPDTTHSFRRFELTDEFGTPDRMPFKPYVRESLRLRAMSMMRQQDTTGYGGDARNLADVMYHDGVACWQFEYDFHPTKREFLDGGDPAGPWRCTFREGRTWGPPYSGLSLFPLRSLVPQRVDGLLGAQKNLGYSSIVSSAVRLHDQSMAIGTAAGAVAAVCVENDIQPRVIPYDRALLFEVWTGLAMRPGDGVPHALWPFPDLGPDHPAFEAANLLAIAGCLPVHPRRPRFDPDEPAAPEWTSHVMERSRECRIIPADITAPSATTRGEFVRAWWEVVRELPVRPFERQTADDADGDGLVDSDDALPFHPHPTSWSHIPVDPTRDGLPDASEAAADQLRRFNFVGRGTASPEGFERDHGLPYDAQRGFGWSRDISESHRRRGRVDETIRDTFLFTRSHDVWELSLPQGRYAVTVCVGDAAYEQAGQHVAVEGATVVENAHTAAGEWIEATTEVEVGDGRLTVEIGMPGGSTNTCLNWIQVSPRR